MPARLSRCSFLGAGPPRTAGRAAAISSGRFTAQDRREAAARDTAYLYERPS
jgi:hypothetical protein